MRILLQGINSTTAIQVERVKGKSKSFGLPKYEYLDINLKTGEFYVLNKFTGNKILRYGDNYTHKMDKASLKRFLERYKEEFLTINREEWQTMET